MAGDGGRRRTVTLLALVVVVVFGAWFAYSSSRGPEQETFCLLGEPMFIGEQRSFSFQDTLPHGGDDCDGPEVVNNSRVLGADCRLRNGDGDVIAELEPNYLDGTCGQANSPYPHSWDMT